MQAMTNYHSFSDLSENMFGRQKDIDLLFERSLKSGLTVITGRPQIGKTWLLSQVAWLLDNKHEGLVGYCESKGESDDHLLRAVIDLYRRWLSSASMYQQLDSLFSRHKDKLITGIGRFVGTIFKEFAPKGGLIESVFKELDTANRDLVTGGIELPPLDYDSCLSLVQIVAKETKEMPTILILDAFEKSPTIQKVYNTLSAFLSHLDDWPTCHILLGIRNRELYTSEQSLRSFELVQDLTNSSSLAELMPLAPMDMSDKKEHNRMLKHVRELAKCADQLDNYTLTQMIDGFPGVIERFRNPKEPDQVNQIEGLYKLVDDAQKYRYREFEKLFPSLDCDKLTMAIRLALFLKLDDTTWKEFRDILCEGLEPTLWEHLRQSRILEQESYPTYGHDTRCNNALQRLKEMRPESVKRELEFIVFGLAKKIQFIDNRDRNFAAALAGLQDKVDTLGLDELYKTLCEAAKGLFSPEFQYSTDLNAAITMIPEICPEAALLIANSLLEQGSNKNKRDDHEGAIADYTAVIDMENATTEPVAKALYSRGLSKYKLGDHEGAIADYTAVIDMENAPTELVARALYNRGLSKDKLDDHEGAIADYTAVIDMENAPTEPVAMALNNRGTSKDKRDDHEGAIADYTAVIDMENAPTEPVAMALYNLGVSKYKLGDHEGAIADYTAVIDMENAPTEPVAMALNDRGVSKYKLGDHEGAIADYTAVIDMENAPTEPVAKASENLTILFIQLERVSDALETAVKAILTDCLSDGGLRLAALFDKHSGAIKSIIEDNRNPFLLRGGGLAFLVAIEKMQPSDYIQKWLKNDTFNEAAKIYETIIRIWTKN